MKRPAVPAIIAVLAVGAAIWLIAARRVATGHAQPVTTRTKAPEQHVVPSEDVIKWIPMLVSAYAVALLAGAYIVAAAVL
jgi:hypothetical protein